MKTALLLIQLGTPDSPSVKDVRKYLSEFLNDPRVIDIPAVARFFLVNGIIIPFRTPKSAKIYQQLWTKDGSPLLLYSQSLQKKLQTSFCNDVDVHLAMRYGNPSMENVLEEMRKKNYSRLLLLPLFPQYASATSGSAIERAMKIIHKWWVIPEIRTISQFYDDEGFISCFVEKGKQYNINDYDHVLFSYHGLPIRQVDKVHADGKPCANHNCENEITEENKFCYKATCYATTRLIAKKLNLPKEKYTVCFQSRLDKNWLEPFTDKTIIAQAEKGEKKLLVFSPAFVADCLETIIEIGNEYQQLFVAHGGEKVQLVESLNDSDAWIEALRKLIQKQIG
ncbi:MAG: ferrochelatase [Ignavibacteriaceae bacterium]|jgi:ferrochelatase|nr:ferrochelatase [Ignavibacteriaceae bacterium]